MTFELKYKLELLFSRKRLLYIRGIQVTAKVQRPQLLCHFETQIFRTEYENDVIIDLGGSAYNRFRTSIFISTSNGLEICCGRVVTTFLYRLLRL